MANWSHPLARPCPALDVGHAVSCPYPFCRWSLCAPLEIGAHLDGNRMAVDAGSRPECLLPRCRFRRARCVVRFNGWLVMVVVTPGVSSH